jgi:SAM-dependent methyltransferase
MTETRLYARFPAVSFLSQAEFTDYCREAQARLDTRYLYESSLATREDVLTQPGTCAPCLRRTEFTTRTARWDRLADGRRTPQWSDALECDCEDRLCNRDRAVLHFAEAVAGLRPWTRLLLFGPPAATDRRRASLGAAATTIPRLLPAEAADAWRLDAGDAAFHLIVAVEWLHRVPPLRAAFAEFRRVLAPGGSLVFTVPFRYRAAFTVSRNDLPRHDGRLPAEYRDAVHEIGWDVLAMLRAAGFRHAAVHSYWSSELGHLGPFNMLLHAAL